MSGLSGSGAETSCAKPAAMNGTSSRAAMYAARMRLKIKRLDPTIPLPGYGTDEAAGFDLAAAHNVTVRPREIALVRTGLVIEVPTGHCLAIFARSSTPLKRGLMVANGVGIIDPDYSGPADEVMIQVLNITDADVSVSRGDRLAQAIILPAPRVMWHEVKEIRDVTRGGFGATGN
jgi:dUTP pyrophosphatase